MPVIPHWHTHTTTLLHTIIVFIIITTIIYRIYYVPVLQTKTKMTPVLLLDLVYLSIDIFYILSQAITLQINNIGAQLGGGEMNTSDKFKPFK